MSLPNKQLFESVPEKSHFGFIKNGKLNQPKKIQEFLELTRKEMSKASGVPEIRYERKRMSKALHDYLINLSIIIEKVAGFFDGDRYKTALWFKIKNPLLGNVAPRDMIRWGRFEKLQKFVDSALSGEYP